jgi:hypothetical protein
MIFYNSFLFQHEKQSVQHFKVDAILFHVHNEHIRKCIVQPMTSRDRLQISAPWGFIRGSLKLICWWWDVFCCFQNRLWNIKNINTSVGAAGPLRVDDRSLLAVFRSPHQLAWTLVWKALSQEIFLQTLAELSPHKFVIVSAVSWVSTANNMAREFY